MKTNPWHWLDWIVWPLLKIFWEPFSLKKSHWWHWRKMEPCDLLNASLGDLKTATAHADRLAKPAESLWDNFYQRNFGWKKVAILMAFENGNEEKKPRTSQDIERQVFNQENNIAKNYRIGYIEVLKESVKIELSSIKINGAAAVLIGPNNCSYFALDEDGRALNCRLLDYTSKKAKRKHKINYIRRATLI